MTEQGVFVYRESQPEEGKELDLGGLTIRGPEHRPIRHIDHTVHSIEDGGTLITDPVSEWKPGLQIPEGTKVILPVKSLVSQAMFNGGEIADTFLMDIMRSADGFTLPPSVEIDARTDDFGTTYLFLDNDAARLLTEYYFGSRTPEQKTIVEGLPQFSDPCVITGNALVGAVTHV